MRTFQNQRESLGGQLVRRAGGVQTYCARKSGQPLGVGLELAPNRPLAEAFYRLRGMHDAYFWHPSMFSPAELRSAFARHGLRTRILAQPRLTGAQLAKLPGPRPLRRVAGVLPLDWLPPTMLPHLEAVASKRTYDTDRS